MRKKVLSLVLSAGMLLSMVPNNVMADTTSQTDSSVAAGQTEEGKTVEAAEKAAPARSPGKMVPRIPAQTQRSARFLLPDTLRN